MAVARGVVDWERLNLDWLSIEDSDENRWRYVKKAVAPGSEPQDVEWNGQGISPTLVRAVQQDEPGLRKRIVVSLLLGTTGGAARGPLGWLAKHEYEQE